MKADELLQRIESNSAPLIVDPRSEMEFKRGHIPGAINAPISKILLNRSQIPQDKKRENSVRGGRCRATSSAILTH
jgi:rhodanese-related sulfurtransferase